MRARALPLLLLAAFAACASSEKRPPLQDPAAPAIMAENDCRPLFRWEPDPNERHSCWNRVWEVPAMIVVVPVGLALLIGAPTAPIWVPLLLL